MITPSLIVMLASGSAAADANGDSLEIELVHPSFGIDSFAGFDDLTPSRFGAARAGVLTGYQQNPLVLRSASEDVEMGVIVAHRQTLTMGGTVALSETLALRTSLPVAVQWGSELPAHAANGILLGDAMLGAKLSQFITRRLAVGGTLDIALPTSTPDTWMGERNLRARAGLLAQAKVGDVDLLGSLTGNLRTPVDTGTELTVGNELIVTGAARYHVLPDHLSLAVGGVLRQPLDPSSSDRSATASEIITGLQLEHGARVQNQARWRTEVGLGKGLADGYGSSGVRVFLGLSHSWFGPHPPAPEPMEFGVAEVVTKYGKMPEPEEPTPDDLFWEPDELARVDAEAIVIRDPIQFEFGTERLLAESIPTLHFVAQLMTEQPDITHLVIEGHASEEGSFVFNYDLSIRRARAVWEELVRAGVHPIRISYRGLGEVVPLRAGALSPSEDETHRAANRRVEFRITSRRDPLDPTPPDTPMPPLPWSGQGAEPDPAE